MKHDYVNDYTLSPRLDASPALRLLLLSHTLPTAG